MAFTNFETKEINCKIIYFGPTGSGKTENLRSIFKNTSKEMQAGLLEMSDERRSTQFFDFLPVSIGKVGDFHFKLHLYTLPAASIYESVQSVLLKGIDGYVMVADSRVEAMMDNLQAISDMKKVLNDEGYNYTDLPKVIQYNKRDFKDIVPLEIMKSELNPTGTLDHEAIAVDSKGTMETLQSMAKLSIKKLSVAQ